MAFALQSLIRPRWSWPRRLGLAGLVALFVALMLLPIRIAEYKLHGYIPLNPGNATQYLRHHAPGSPDARPWGHWDYPRMLRELRDAGRLLDIERGRREDMGT
jgi:hypothetical protein